MKSVFRIALAMLALTSVDARGLEFNWPETMQASVRYTIEGKRLQGPSSYEFKRTLSYQMSVEPDGSLLRIQRTPPTATPTEYTPPIPGGIPAQEMLDDIAEYIPTWIVGKNGGFVGVRDTADVLSSFGDAVDRTRFTDEVKAATRKIVSEGMLQDVARETWRGWAEVWADLSFTPGETQHEERTAVFPGTSTPLELSVNWVLEEGVPCFAGDASNSCVAISIRSEPKTEGLIESLATHAATMGSKGIVEANFEQNQELIAEPLTLKPHKLTNERISTVKHAPGSLRENTGSSETRTWEFTYGSDVP